jgi:hypothetical protein
MNKPKSVHGGRTIMFSELEKVMEFSLEHGQFDEAMGENVFGKKSSNGIKQTKGFLKRLYSFDLNILAFKVFRYFWIESEAYEKPLLAILYAISNDDHLKNSIDVLNQVKLGEKVNIESLEDNIQKFYPKRYSVNTTRSMAQNIASSWKQAGFIVGKVKNTRVQPDISFKVVAFAMLISYLNGERGDFILNSNTVKALCLSENRIRELAIEASKRDYLQYQFAGNVTAVSFDNLLSKIGINAI